MYIRPAYLTKNGKRHAYWALVKSVRTPRGPRQRTVAYIGDATQDLREGVLQAAQGERQGRLFDEVKPEWVEVDLSRVQPQRPVQQTILPSVATRVTRGRIASRCASGWS
jgi:hypothetical protein